MLAPAVHACSAVLAAAALAALAALAAAYARAARRRAHAPCDHVLLLGGCDGAARVAFGEASLCAAR
jgi:hypothetical protein